MLRILIDEVSYPEGPIASRNGLLFVEYTKDRVVLWDGSNRHDVWHEDGSGPTGVIEQPDSTLWVAAHDANCLIRISKSGTEIDRIAADDTGVELGRPNDLVAASWGGFFVTAPGTFDRSNAPTSRVLYYDKSHGIRSCACNIAYSNGLVLTRDEGTLVVAEHLRNRLLAYDVQRDGTLNHKGVFSNFFEIAPIDSPHRDLGPDGLAVDIDGNIYVAHYGAGRIIVLAPEGMLRNILAVPMRFVTNVAIWHHRLIVTALAEDISPYRGAVYYCDVREALH